VNQEEALLAAVRDAPWDDAPRLILADWLEENGGPEEIAHAEFIRVQCELAAGTPAPTRRRQRKARAKQLRDDHAAQWLGPLAEVSRYWSFTRGLACVEMAATTFLSPRVQQELGGWLRRARVLELELEGKTKRWAAVASSPHLARLARLGLSRSQIGDDLGELTRSDHLASLRDLMVVKSKVTDRGLAALADSTSLPGLRVLNLIGNHIGPDGVRVLWDSPLLAQLRGLFLGDNPLGAWGIKILTDSPLLSGLRDLRLGGAGSAGTIETLAESCSLGSLENLILSSSGAGAQGAVALASSPHLPALKKLDVCVNKIGASGVCALLDAPEREQLRWLQVSYNNLGNKGARAIASCSGLSRLTTLKLSKNGIKAEGVRALAGSPHAAGLRELSLSDNPFGDDGALALASSPHLGGLVRLEVSNCSIGPVGKAALLERFGDAVYLEYEWAEAPLGKWG
jgi:uncharacterized protein (TIGR02996 family)